MPVILGIDPGLSGAMAWLDSDGRLLHLYDMPVIGGAVDALAFDRHLELVEERLGRPTVHHKPERAILEWPGVMPKNGALTARSMGISLATVETVCLLRGIAVERVAPGTWKRAMGLNAVKADSRAMASRYWPEAAHHFARKKDDGRAEAALIARWWLTKGDGAKLVADGIGADA